MGNTLGNMLIGAHLDDLSHATVFFDVVGRRVDRSYEYIVNDLEFGAMMADLSILFETKKSVPKKDLEQALTDVIKDVINSKAKGQIEISVSVYYVLSWDATKYNLEYVRIAPHILSIMRSPSDNVTMVLNSSQKLQDLVVYYDELNNSPLDKLVESYYHDQKAKAGMFSWMMRDTYIEDLLVSKLVNLYTD